MEKGKIVFDMDIDTFKLSDKTGFSLIEMMITVTIMGILLGIATPQLIARLRIMNVRDCAQKLAAEIRHVRASAMSEGRRAQLVITDNGSKKNFGNGQDALWMTFIDSKTPTGSFVASDKVLSCSSCATGMTIETISGIQSLPVGLVGTGGATNLSMWFSAIGTLKETSIDSSIIITAASDKSFKARIYITSLTGYVRVQTCTVAGTVICSNKGNAT